MGFEGEAVQSGLPVDVRDRGRPSAQFARESSPAASTKKTVFDGLFYFVEADKDKNPPRASSLCYHLVRY